jgi:hypothetical protein
VGSGYASAVLSKVEVGTLKPRTPKAAYSGARVMVLAANEFVKPKAAHSGAGPMMLVANEFAELKAAYSGARPMMLLRRTSSRS